MTLTTAYIVIVVLACLVAAFVVSLFFRVDDKVELRRKVAVDMIPVLNENGLDDFMPLAKCYATGDYSGVAAEIEKVVANLQSTEKAKQMFEKLFYKQLTDRLANPVEKIKIHAEVAKKPADLEAAAKASAKPATTAA